MHKSENDQQKLSSLLEETDSGISAEEQNSILSQIDQMFDASSAMEDIHDLSYQPQKNGSFFPVLTGVSVLLLTIASVLLLFTFHYKQEQSILNQGGSIVSAEGTILKEFRQETEEELQGLRLDLSALEQERDELSSRTEQIIERQTREFKQELQARMSEERLRLETAGVSRTEIEEQLEQYRDELTEQYSQELAAVRAEAEQKMEEQERQIAQLSQSYENRIEEFEGDRETALRELAGIQERQQEAELLSQQIASAYLSAIGALENDNFESARRSLGVVEDLLARESLRSVPGTARRLPADRKILSALSQYISLKEGSRIDRTSSQQNEAELEELRQTISQLQDELQAKDERIAALSESTENLTARLQNTRGELSQAQNRLETVRREIEELRTVKRSFSTLADYFETLAEELSHSSETPQGNRGNEEILVALSDKLEILEMLKSESVRRQNPDMEKLFNNYLDTFEQEYQRQGYLEALQDTRLLIRSVHGNEEPAEKPYFRLDGNAVLQAAAQLVEELEHLVTP